MLSAPLSAIIGIVLQCIIIFIDGSSFYKNARQHTNGAFRDSAFDYYDLSQRLAGSRDLRRTYYYTAKLKDHYKTETSRTLVESQRRFLAVLDKTPYLETRLGRMMYPPDGKPPHQKGVDTRIAIDMVKMAVDDRYDVGILISADSDLCEAVQAAKDLGRHIELARFSTCRDYHLQTCCDRSIQLDDIVDEMLGTGQDTNAE